MDQSNIDRVISEPKKSLQSLELDKTNYKDLVFARDEFLGLVGVPNDSLRLIIIHYMI